MKTTTLSWQGRGGGVGVMGDGLFVEVASGQENGSRALPIMLPGFVAFMAIPGREDVVK